MLRELHPCVKTADAQAPAPRRTLRQRDGPPCVSGRVRRERHRRRESRENYVWLGRTEAERRGVGWAYWDDGGSFKIMNVSNGA
jgi:hypothetical protein